MKASRAAAQRPLTGAAQARRATLSRAAGRASAIGRAKNNSLRTGLCRFLPIEARRSALWGQAYAVFSPFRLGARLSEDRPMPFSPRLARGQTNAVCSPFN